VLHSYPSSFSPSLGLSPFSSRPPKEVRPYRTHGVMSNWRRPFGTVCYSAVYRGTSVDVRSLNPYGKPFSYFQSSLQSFPSVPDVPFSSPCPQILSVPITDKSSASPCVGLVLIQDPFSASPCSFLERPTPFLPLSSMAVPPPSLPVHDGVRSSIFRRITSGPELLPLRMIF